MMLIGGSSLYGGTVGQVLTSSDGVSWVDEVDDGAMVDLVSREDVSVASDGFQVVMAGGARHISATASVLMRDVLTTFYHCHDTGCSNAGREWTYGSASAQWSQRAGCHLVSMGDTMLLVGGWVLECMFKCLC
mmetsp:Transcript_42383/g.102293  ORF Transcript_42383/g.102293 Transcript_42383/m.102293 type:complete len:133 (-) Transcript_42383:1096-1494(-)